MKPNGKTRRRSRVRFLLAALLIIGAGLLVRWPGWHLPFLLYKYGGSLLWGAMVYFVLGFLLAGTRAYFRLGLAIGLAVAVEFFRLYHLPWLDEFRLTLAGALLLGRVFSLWNIAAYALGIVFAFLSEPYLDRA